MLDFQLKVKSEYDETLPEYTKKVNAFCEELRGYGYSVEAQYKHAFYIVNLKIEKGGTVFCDREVALTPEFINGLARFTQKTHVQYTLDELMPRLDLIGAHVSLNTRSDLVHHNYVHVTYYDGKGADYAPAYEGMLQLRSDVDVAEVHYLVGAAWPKIQKAGWKRVNSDGCYAFARPRGGISIPYGDVDEARQVLRLLEHDLPIRDS